ncbi:MAG: recombinase family protein [Anaerolineales bacterium]|nr:recombinase family protein [Anaerolineales bacterium]
MNDYIYPPPATLPPGSTVIAYLRDSGGPNQDESIRQQERVILDYCKKYGLVLSHIFSETASGRKTEKREQFLEMYDFLINYPKEIQTPGLILWAYSRFSRDVLDFNYFLNGLLRKGVIVHSLTEQIPDGIAGQMMLSYKAFTNADYSIQLGKQIKRGIADIVKAGYSNGGVPPKGYRIFRDYKGLRRNGTERTGVKWEPDPVLAPLVRLAWELRAQGVSYAEITKATNGQIYTSLNSWVTHFENESYIGIGKAGDLRVENHHEPLIPLELWEAVRKIQKKQKNFYHHQHIKFPSLLAGLANCIYCGAAMVIHTSKGYRAYTCGKRDRKKGYANCPESRRVNAPKVETLILDKVFNRVLSAEFINQILADVQAQMTDTNKLEREISEANNSLASIERSIARVIKMVEETGEIEELKKRLIELKQNQSEHKEKINSLIMERDTKAPQVTPEALTAIFETWRKQIYNANERGDLLTAKRLLMQFIQRVELSYKKAIIHYTYPLSNPADDESKPSAHTVTSL